MPYNHYQNAEELKRLKRLFYIRQLFTLLLLLLFTWLTGYSNDQLSLPLQSIWGIWLLLAFIQFSIIRWLKRPTFSLVAQLLSDLLLIGFLIYSSGGISSPIIFLLGLVIIVAGTQAHPLIVLIIAVLAPTTYLIAVYAYAAKYQQHIISDEYTLRILLQTSLFFLAGGIMALIARRHASLQHEQAFTVAKHQQLENIHAQVLNTMQEGIIILDSNLVIQDLNSAAATTLNIPKNVQVLLHSVLKTPQDMHSFIHNNDLDVFKTEILHQQQCLLITLTRLTNAPISWLMTIVDITETRQLERKLAEQDKLASIGQMASILAHEIRNPMQTISQAVELMGLQIKERNLEHIVIEEISRLNRLVSDTLDYASPFQPHIQHTNIYKLIQTSVSQVDLKNKYKIKTTIPQRHINLDPDHFRLVLDNLIRNAIQASPTPASIHVVFDGDERNWSLKVTDHGAGISNDLKKTLFEPFRTGRKQGTGLGLATAWQVCQVNQWTIDTDDTISSGTCFVVACSCQKINQQGHING